MTTRLDVNIMASQWKELSRISMVGLFIQGPCLVNSQIDIINEILGDCWNGDMLVVTVDQDQFAVPMFDDVFEELGFL